MSRMRHASGGGLDAQIDTRRDEQACPDNRAHQNRDRPVFRLPVFRLKVGDGRLELWRFRCTWLGKGIWHSNVTISSVTDPGHLPVKAHALGFYWFSQSRRQVRGLVIPAWALVLFTAIPPMWRTVSWRATKVWRASQRICPSCGYDLRASTGRCPECGTPIAPNVGANP
jgi:hypothetical protein